MAFACLEVSRLASVGSVLVIVVCPEAFLLQGHTPRPRSEVLHRQPKPETGPSTGSSHRESGPPTDNLHRHRRKRDMDHLQTVKTIK
jgi:hypothetical protein